MHESNRRNIEFYIPLEVSPDDQCFGIVGFVRDEHKLSLDVSYTRWDKDQGLILRTAINDGHTYKIVNRVIDVGSDYMPKYLNQLPKYDDSLYDPKSVKLWGKQLSLTQISIFTELTNQIIKERGLENATQEDIFNNKQVKDILGLGFKNPYDFTHIRNVDSALKLELA